MYSAKAIANLAKENGIEMPITLAVNDLIEKKYSVTEIIDNLLNRPIKEEN
jgi:glycerol-3-phosphate dehydrogenase (NAD(P)+)